MGLSFEPVGSRGVEVFPVYVDEYRDKGTSLLLAKVADERYVTSGTDLPGIPSFAAHCSIICDDGCEELGLGILGDEDERDFQKLVTAVTLKRAGVRGKSCEVHEACRCENGRYPAP